MVDPFEAIKVTFFQECDELLADLEQGLLAMDAGDANSETVNAVFRAVHSIKGGAGAFGLEALVRFAHVFETALDRIRSGALVPDPHVMKVMLRSSDVLADHVQGAKTGAPANEQASAMLAEELAHLSGEGATKPTPALATPVDERDEGEGAPTDEADFKPLRVEIDLEPADGGAKRWVINFRPFPSLYARGNDSSLVLRELARLGTCVVALNADDLPALEELDPAGAYLGWRVDLEANCTREQIAEVFEFVEGECDLSIVSDEAQTHAPVDVLALIAAAQGAAPAPIAERKSSDDALSAPAAKPASEAVKAQTPPAQATIRVDLDRVDRLIDLIGELVINQAMLAQRVMESGIARSSTIAMGLDELEQLTRDIQDSVMAIRAQPVKSVFQRMPRLVREVASATGKEVRLVMEGENTEVDKTVIERLSDPITHMLRNAIDHGLETPDARAEAGKSPEGTVRLAALHRSGRIVIEVSDDGKGIDRTRVRAIAQKRGLIDPEAVLTDEEVDNLIFLPGFSTAEAVTDFSGRGVGMDVVKRSIQSLGGRITIASRPGKGSTFTLSLPLTLAVLDGMVVSAGTQTFVAPLTTIVETLKPKASDIRRLGPGSAVIAIRDSYVPIIDVARELGLRDRTLERGEGVVLLVESELGGRAALLVDAIQGQRQVVIKSLEANYQRVDCIAAATILGDGRVALILDTDALVSSRHGAGAREPLAKAS